MKNRHNPIAKAVRKPEFRMRVVGAVKGKGSYRKSRYKLTINTAMNGEYNGSRTD